MSGIEKYTNNGNGFFPLCLQKDWQVAILSFFGLQDVNAIDKVEVHHDTDEVFLLQQGSAVLVNAEIKNNTILSWHAELLLPRVIYNVPRGLWHNIAMKEDSVIFIVEKRDTHLHDVEYRMLDDTERLHMRAEINKEWQ